MLAGSGLTALKLITLNAVSIVFTVQNPVLKLITLNVVSIVFTVQILVCTLTTRQNRSVAVARHKYRPHDRTRYTASSGLSEAPQRGAGKQNAVSVEFSEFVAGWHEN